MVELSVIIPVYGEPRHLRELITRILDTLAEANFEIILVDDLGPGDRWIEIQELANKYSEIVAVQLARNFGQHNALLCGLSLSSGELVITIDDDLQIPPEEIPKLIRALDPEKEVVYGIPRIKKHEWFRNFGSWCVWKLFMITFQTSIRPSAFRIIRRRIVDRIVSYSRSFVYLDGLIAWETSRFAEVEVDHQKRVGGRSGYSLSKLVVLTLNFVTAFSLRPLQISSLAGLSSACFAFLLGLTLLLRKILIGIPVPGYASLAVLISFLAGVQLISLGVIGEYIGRLLMSSNSRPPFSVYQILRSKKF